MPGKYQRPALAFGRTPPVLLCPWGAPSASAALGRQHRPVPVRGAIARFFRYTAVSVVFTVMTFIALAILVGGLNVPAGWANFAVITAGIPTGFEANRRWVWARSDGPWWKAPQLVPFAAFSFAVLILSTFSVHEVGLAVAHWSRAGRTVAVEAASLASSATIWIIQFFVLDRVLFKTHGAHAVDPEQGEARAA